MSPKVQKYHLVVWAVGLIEAMLLKHHVYPAFICLLLFSQAWSQPVPIAAVYYGPAVCHGCPQSLAKVIKQAGYDVRKIYVGGITAEALKGVALFAIPGGDDVDELMSALMPGGAGVIKKFIYEGGSYLGVCLGAYVASESGLGLFSGSINAHAKNIDARMEKITWHGQARWVYFQDGPEFELKNNSKIDIWAKYKTGELAALQYRYGQGYVGLVGPHLEADQSWLSDDHLIDPDGDDSALLVDFIKTIRDNSIHQHSDSDVN